MPYLLNSARDATQDGVSNRAAGYACTGKGHKKKRSGHEKQRIGHEKQRIGQQKLAKYLEGLQDLGSLTPHGVQKACAPPGDCACISLLIAHVSFHFSLRMCPSTAHCACILPLLIACTTFTKVHDLVSNACNTCNGQ